MAGVRQPDREEERPINATQTKEIASATRRIAGSKTRSESPQEKQNTVTAAMLPANQNGPGFERR